MISVSNRKDNNLLNPDEYFENIYKNRYKDTPFAIVQGRDNGWWQTFVIDDVFNKDNVYLINGTYSKDSAINAIESGSLVDEIKHQYENYLAVYGILKLKGLYK